MWAKRCEMCLALEITIEEWSSRTAIFRSVQLNLQSNRTRRRLQLSFSHCYHSMTQPSLNLNSYLMNLLAQRPESLLLWIQWNLVSA
jgi:transcriptional antiterminator